MTIASIEGIPVNLAGGELIQAIEQPKTGKLAGLCTHPGCQRVGIRIAHPTVEPPSGGDEGGSARSRSSREHPTRPMKFSTECLGPKISKSDRCGQLGN